MVMKLISFLSLMQYAQLCQSTNIFRGSSDNSEAKKQKKNLQRRLDDDCQLSIETQCTAPDGVTSCELLPNVVDLCLDIPTDITMLYKASLCENDNDLCEDYSSALPNDAYIVAKMTSRSDNDIVLFEGFVSLGRTFDLQHDENQLVDDVTIQVYDNDLKTSILQRVTIPTSSCGDPTQPLFIFQETLGASQVVGMTSELTGALSLFEVPVLFKFTMTNTSPSGQTVALQSLQSLSQSSDTINPIIWDLTEDIAGEFVDSGDSVTVVRPITLDMISQADHTFVTTGNGEAVATENHCHGASTLAFNTGGLEQS